MTCGTRCTKVSVERGAGGEKGSGHFELAVPARTAERTLFKPVCRASRLAVFALIACEAHIVPHAPVWLPRPYLSSSMAAASGEGAQPDVVAAVPTEWGKNLRCCVPCRLLKTFEQFYDQGCENCPFLAMDGDRDRIFDCTTTEFQARAGCRAAGWWERGAGAAGPWRLCSGSGCGCGASAGAVLAELQAVGQRLADAACWVRGCWCRAWWRWWTRPPAGAPSGCTSATRCPAATRCQRQTKCRPTSRTY